MKFRTSTLPRFWYQYEKQIFNYNITIGFFFTFTRKNYNFGKHGIFFHICKTSYRYLHMYLCIYINFSFYMLMWKRHRTVIDLDWNMKVGNLRSQSKYFLFALSEWRWLLVVHKCSQERWEGKKNKGSARSFDGDNHSIKKQVILVRYIGACLPVHNRYLKNIVPYRMIFSKYGCIGNPYFDMLSLPPLFFYYFFIF